MYATVHLNLSDVSRVFWNFACALDGNRTAIYITDWDLGSIPMQFQISSKSIVAAGDIHRGVYPFEEAIKIYVYKHKLRGRITAADLEREIVNTIGKVLYHRKA